MGIILVDRVARFNANLKTQIMKKAILSTLLIGCTCAIYAQTTINSPDSTANQYNSNGNTRHKHNKRNLQQRNEWKQLVQFRRMEWPRQPWWQQYAKQR